MTVKLICHRCNADYDIEWSCNSLTPCDFCASHSPLKILKSKSHIPPNLYDVSSIDISDCELPDGFDDGAIRAFVGGCRLFPLVVVDDAADEYDITPGVIFCCVIGVGTLIDFGSWLELYGGTIAVGFFCCSAFGRLFEFADEFGELNNDAQHMVAGWVGVGVVDCGTDAIFDSLADSD